VEARYRGSSLGLFWSLANPLIMLAVFTFVFAVVFQARWGQENASTFSFAIITFAGLCTFNLFSEVVLKSPTLITLQPNLVKKVVFPLAILPLVALFAALFHAAVALALLLAVQSLFGSGFHATALLVPLLFVPLILFTLGVSWFLSALGVYVRDIGQVVSPLNTMLMFLTPIFYPVSALPEWIRPMATVNPLAMTIEQVRNALILGHGPDMAAWTIAALCGALVAIGGFAFFRKTRKGFADVL
jgi:lipopolysaccharide transport system permease protein